MYVSKSQQCYLLKKRSTEGLCIGMEEVYVPVWPLSISGTMFVKLLNGMLHMKTMRELST